MDRDSIELLSCPKDVKVHTRQFSSPLSIPSMKKQMKKRIIKTICAISLLLLNSTFLFSQTLLIHAGSNQIINWEKTHSAELNGSVSSAKITVEWACPQNSKVVFKNASSLVTKVTLRRPGYYVLFLSSQGTDKDSVRSSTVVNVFEPNSYKERLADLIGLMTVDEKYVS